VKRAKQAIKFQILVVLPRQILMYYCLGKQSEPKFQTVLVLPSQILIYFCVGERSELENSSCFSKSNPNASQKIFE